MKGDKLKIIYAGRMVQEQKRIFDTVLAFCDAAKKIDGIEITMAGSGYRMNDVKRILAIYGNGLPIDAIGEVPPDKIQKVMSDHHVFALLSDYEGLPIALMDAMAMGLVPVCTGMRSGIPELITDEVNGFIVKNRKDDFICTINRLKNENGLWHRVSDAAYETIKEKYDIKMFAGRWKRLFETLTTDLSRKPIEIPSFIELPPVKTRPLGMAIQDKRMESPVYISSESKSGTDAKKKSKNRYEEIQYLLKNKSYKEAELRLEDFLRDNPDHALAHNDYGALCFQKDERQKAAHYFGRAAELEPDNRGYLKNLGTVYFYTGKIKESFEIFTNLLEKYPDDKDVLTGLVDIFRSLKIEEGVRSKLKRSSEIKPDNPPPNHIKSNNKVAVIEAGFPTVSETFILDQITGLIDRGLNIENWALQKTNPKAVHENIAKYKLDQVTKYLRYPSIDYRKEPDEWLSNFLTLNNIDIGSISLFHVHFGPVFNALATLFMTTNKPVIVSFHGYDASQYFKQFGDNCYGYLFKRANVITTPSHTMKNELVKRGCDPDIILVHRYGVDLNTFRQENREFGKIPVVFLTVARFVEKKGLEYSIKAFAKIRNKLKAQYRIIGDGELKGKIINMLREHNLENDVILLGERTKEEVQDEMRKADIYLLTSVTAGNGDMEGVPVSLIEAHSMGLPVISTYHSGIPELVIHGKTGLLTKERDIENTARNMRQLSEDSELRKKFSVAARKRAEEEFDIEKLNDRLADILKAKGKKNKLSKQSKPLISVCIPTYNRSRYLKKAIKSVINQSREDVEVVVVDDGGTDNSEMIVNEIGHDQVRYYKNDKNQGRPLTRNKCIEYSRGKYIVWLDDDDKLADGTLKRYSDIIQNERDIDVLYGQLQIIDIKGKITGNRISAPDYTGNGIGIIQTFFKGNAGIIPNPGSLVRKLLYKKYGGYDPEFKRAQDAEFWLRIAPYANFRKVEGIVGYYRTHENNISSGPFIDLSFESLLLSKLLNSDSRQYILSLYDLENSDENRYRFYLDIAVGFYRFNDFYNASKVLKKLLQEKRSSECERILIRCYLRMGEIEKAEKLINKQDDAEDLNKGFNALRSLRKTIMNGISKDNHGNLMKEIEKVRNTVNLGESTVDLLYGMGLLKESQSKELAYKYFKSAVCRNPEHEEAYKKGISLEEKLKKMSQIKEIRIRLTENIHIPEYHSLKKFKGIKEMISESEELINRKKYEKARELLTVLLSTHPDNVDALNNLSKVYLFEGKYREAALTVDKVVDIDPFNKKANETLKYLEQLFVKQND